MSLKKAVEKGSSNLTGFSVDRGGQPAAVSARGALGCKWEDWRQSRAKVANFEAKVH